MQKKSHWSSFRHLHIPAYLGIFKYIQELLRHIQNSVQNPGIFRTRDIQNPVKHLRWNILRKYVAATFIFPKHFCNISFPRSPLQEINIFCNTGPIFTPGLYILCKKTWKPSGAKAVNFDIPFIIQI